MTTGSAPTLISRERFVRDVGAAVTARAAYAGGKIGFSEQHWLHYPVFLAGTADRRKIKAYELVLWHHFERQSGVFPSTPELAHAFVARYAQDVRELDCLGLFETPLEPAIIRHHQLRCRFIRARDIEPDRSTPADDARCYLQYFRGKRLLLVAPFAELLRQRAERDTFERIWSRIGKRWFYPESVAAIEFPYGFAAGTRSRFRSVLDLHDAIAARIAAIDFDVALIAAGGLGIPLAAHIKRSGRVALSLGGHLQVLFGIIGQRWRQRESWQRRYFNQSWIDMPERYRPPGWEQLTDGGAYW